MTIAALDALMRIFGLKRIARQSGNVITPVKFEEMQVLKHNLQQFNNFINTDDREWQPVSTMPLKTLVQIKSVKGLLRFAKGRRLRSDGLRMFCTNDLVAIAWRPLP